MASAAAEEGSGSAAANDGNEGGARLFSGIKLWFSRAVPQREWLIQNAQLNGAEIVPLEKQADILLVDHARKNQPPGTTSYLFVLRSIQKGELEDLDDHAVGTTTRVARPVGSVTTAPKGGRNPFTDAEDQFLWDMVQPYRAKGGTWKGNKIYEQIEEMNPRHTFQSWRDRYIKHVQFQDRQVTEDNNLNPQPTLQERHVSQVRPPASQPAQQGRHASPIRQLTRPPTEVFRQVSPPKVMGLPQPRVIIPAKNKQQIQREVIVGPSQRERSRNQVVVEEEQGTTRLHQPTQRAQQAQRPHTPDQQDDDSDTGSPIFTPSSQQTPETQRRRARRARSPVEFNKPHPYGFTDHDAKKLFHRTPHFIEHINKQPQDWNKAWKGLGRSNLSKGHTGQEWKNFWETVIFPAYCERHSKSLSDFVDLSLLGGEISEADTDDEGDSEDEEAEDRDRCAAKETDKTMEEDDAVAKQVQEGLADAAKKEQDETGRQAQGSREAEAAERDTAAPADQTEVEESEAPSSPGVISCTKCFTTSSRKWRRDKEGNLLCKECGWFLKSSGIRPSLALTDIGEEQKNEGQGATDRPHGPGARQQRLSDRRSSTLPAAPTPSKADAGVQISPIVPSATPEKRQQRSPSFEPDTPSQSRPETANIAKKRSDGPSSKSTSQETNKSSQNQQQASPAKSTAALNFIEEEHQLRRTHLVRVRSPSTPDTAPSSRKRRRIQDDPNTLEIQQTPEHRQEAIGSFDVVNAQRSYNSPSPQSLHFKTLKSSTPHSPMFVPQDSEEEPDEEDLPSPISDRPQSSPIHVNLVSEQDQQNQTQDDALSDADTASQYAFETAPDISQDWETAPEEMGSQHPRKKARIETQALWDTTDQVVGDAGALEDEFALPEPEGGWEMIEAGYEEQDQDEAEDEIVQTPADQGEEEYEDNEASDADDFPDIADVFSGKYIPKTNGKGKELVRQNDNSHLDTDDEADSNVDEENNEVDYDFPDYEAWYLHISHVHPLRTLPNTLDLETLSSDAVYATSFNYSLATKVVERMISLHSSNRVSATRQAAESAGIKVKVAVPNDMPGCFTEEDDNLLLADKKGDWERMERKHGWEACQGRFDFLETWNRVPAPTEAQQWR